MLLFLLYWLWKKNHDIDQENNIEVTLYVFILSINVIRDITKLYLQTTLINVLSSYIKFN